MYRIFLAVITGFSPLYSISQVSHVTLEVKKIPEPTVRDSLVDSWNERFLGYNKLSNAQKEMLYWTNYSRANPKRFWDSAISPILKIFPQLNKSEASSLKAELSNKTSLPLFNLNPGLTQTSQAHAKDITTNNLGLSHSSSAGVDFSGRMREAGIKFCAGENIAVANDNILLSLVLLYLDVGLKDAGHRKALLSSSFTEIGIGAATSKTGQTFIVQDFSCTQ